MKNFLLGLVVALIGYFLAPFYYIAVFAWIWLPAVFDFYNLFGGVVLGFVLGLAVTIATLIISEKVEKSLEDN